MIDTNQLLAQAQQAAHSAYAPFSNFYVGAALLTADGRVYLGANVENSSYGLTICAERVAVFKAVTDGARELVAVAVTTRDGARCPPCGACRQVLYEFGPEMTVILAAPAGPEPVTLRTLLPEGFRLS